MRPNLLYLLRKCPGEESEERKRSEEEQENTREVNDPEEDMVVEDLPSALRKTKEPTNLNISEEDHLEPLHSVQ